MHSYSVDTQIRKFIFSSLGVIAFLLAAYLNRTFASLPAFGVSFGAVFGLLVFCFDQWLWKLLARFNLLPNLNGTWVGQGTSSYVDDSGVPVKYESSFKIKQTFTNIEVFMETDSSTSKSVLAGLHVNTASPELIYVYDNKPKNSAPEDMKGHSGTQWLRFSGGNTLKGDYFTGRGRGRTGTLVFKKDTNCGN